MNVARPRLARRLAALIVTALVASFALVASAPAVAVSGISGTLTVELQESGTPARKLAAMHIELVNSGGTQIETGLTGLDGKFAFTTTLDPLEAYQVYVEPDDRYLSVGVGDMTEVTGNSTTINLVPAPGTITGEIANWDSTLIDGLATGDGTFPTLLREDPLGGWEWVADGEYIYGPWFRVAGVYDSEDYLVAFNPYYPSDFYPTSSDGAPFGYFGPTPGVGVAGDPLGEVTDGPVMLLEASFISGTVAARDATHPASLVIVASELGLYTTPAVLEFAGTDPDGDWEVKVAAGDEYVVMAQDIAGDYYEMTWDDHLGSVGCPCGFDYNPVNVISGGMTPGIDFTLVPYDTSVMFEVYLTELDLQSLPDELDLGGVTVHLYKKVTGGWQEVDSRDSSAIGLTYVAGKTNGTYRVRFSQGSDWLPFTRYTDDVGTDFSVAASCYLDITGTTLSDDLFYDFLIDPNASSPACGPEATPSSGSGTTTGSTGHTRTRTSTAPVPDFAVPTATPTPTPTPEPSKTTEPDEQTTSPTPAPVVDSADFSWLLWLIIVIVVLGVGSVVFFILRRR